LPISVQDPASFHCALAYAAHHRTILEARNSLEQTRQMRQYIYHYTAAISSIKERICNPKQNTSDEMIAAVILLACDVSSIGVFDSSALMMSIARFFKFRSELYKPHGWCRDDSRPPRRRRVIGLE
jgi:hypothetical protein